MVCTGGKCHGASLELLTWMAVAIVLHDGVIVPLSTLAGAGLTRLGPGLQPASAAVLRGALLTGAVLTLITGVLLKAQSEARNTTVLRPTTPGTCSGSGRFSPWQRRPRSTPVNGPDAPVRPQVRGVRRRGPERAASTSPSSRRPTPGIPAHDGLSSPTKRVAPVPATGLQHRPVGDVDVVVWFHLDQQRPLRRDQLPAPAQQLANVSADADIAVKQQRRLPQPGLRNGGKHGCKARTPRLWANATASALVSRPKAPSPRDRAADSIRPGPQPMSSTGPPRLCSRRSSSGLASAHQTRTSNCTTPEPAATPGPALSGRSVSLPPPSRSAPAYGSPNPCPKTATFVSVRSASDIALLVTVHCCPSAPRRHNDPFDLTGPVAVTTAGGIPAGEAVLLDIRRYVHPKAVNAAKDADAGARNAASGIDYLRLVETRHKTAMTGAPISYDKITTAAATATATATATAAASAAAKTPGGTP